MENNLHDIQKKSENMDEVVYTFKRGDDWVIYEIKLENGDITEIIDTLWEALCKESFLNFNDPKGILKLKK